MSDKKDDSLWTSLLQGVVDSLGSQLLHASERNPADPVTRMEPVREERRQAGEEAIFRATEGARGTAPMERVVRERRYVARAMAERQAAGAMATRKGAPARPQPVPPPSSSLLALVVAANETLTTRGVPPMNVAVGNGKECQFSCKTWTMTVPGAFFFAMPDEWLPELASSCYHQARHAEQYFNIARMLAARGRTAKEISDACHGMAAAQVQLAHSQPMPSSDPRAEAYQRMLEELTANLELAQEVWNRMGPGEAAAAAWDQARQSNSPDAPRLRAELEALAATFKPLIARYQALGAEVDALAIEEQVRAMWP